MNHKVYFDKSKIICLSQKVYFDNQFFCVNHKVFFDKSNIICVSQKVYFEYKIVEIKLFVGVGKYILKVKHYLCES